MTIFLGVMAPVFTILWMVFHETPYWESLDPFIAVMGLLSTIIGYGLWKVKPWGLYAYFTMSTFILAVLLYQFVLAPNLEDGLVFFGVATFIFGSCVAVQKHINAPYFNPNFHWSRRDVRHHVGVDATFEIDHKLCRGNLLDISRNGCFADFETIHQLGQKFDLGIRVFNVDLKVKAQVVRSCEKPKGFGIMFFGITKEQRSQIESIISQAGAKAAA